MLTEAEIEARIAAGLWLDGWHEKTALEREQAALAYAPGADVDRVIDVIEAAADAEDCPIRNDFEGAVYWPPHWAIEHDPKKVRAWIRRRDANAIPYDLREE